MSDAVDWHRIPEFVHRRLLNDSRLQVFLSGVSLHGRTAAILAITHERNSPVSPTAVASALAVERVSRAVALPTGERRTGRLTGGKPAN